MRIVFTLLFLYCATFSTTSFGQNKIDQLFATDKLKTSLWSVYAIDANSGTPVAETAQKSLSTASTMKLLTTAVAMKMLGPEFTFRTTFGYSGSLDTKGVLTGNLVIQGGSDPAFYSTYFADVYQSCFEKAVNALKSSGIRSVHGKLILDLSSMDNTVVPGGWSWDDIGNYYGAGVSALTYSDNLYEIHFSSPKEAGKAAKINFFVPEIPGLKMNNQVVSSLRKGDHTIVYGAPGSYAQVIEGTIPVDQQDFFVKASIPDPAMLAGEVFLTKLKEGGIQISGKPEKSTLPVMENTSVVFTQVSPPLKELIVPLNHESLNLYAEHLLREIGRKKFGVPSINKSLEALTIFCKENQIDTLGFYPADGSGLSRSNALTSRTLVGALKMMYDSPDRDVYFNSFPLAGVDGTLKNSFKGTPLEHNVLAKTGSMERVRSLAGKMSTKDGRTVLFAILLNNFDLTSTETSKLLENILMEIWGNEK